AQSEDQVWYGNSVDRDITCSEIGGRIGKFERTRLAVIMILSGLRAQKLAGHGTAAAKEQIAVVDADSDIVDRSARIHDLAAHDPFALRRFERTQFSQQPVQHGRGWLVDNLAGLQLKLPAHGHDHVSGAAAVGMAVPITAQTLLKLAPPGVR